MIAKRRDLVSFQQALQATESHRRHLLLGNGFSLSAHNDFGYPSLYKRAVSADPSLAALFADGNTNFEDALRQTTTSVDERRLREALIKAVGEVHPYSSLKLTDGQCRSAWSFLKPFIGRDRTLGGSVFTTNYDLLLLWVVARQPKSPTTKQHGPLKAHDGFTSNGTWEPLAETQVYYLHGAAHIFERPYNSSGLKSYTKMLRYEPTRTPLTVQISHHLAAGDLPVFVAEGTASRKLGARWDRDYLMHASKQFAKVCSKEDGVLFTFGHSLGESDNHIIKYITDGRIGTVYLGVFSAQDVEHCLDLAASWPKVRGDAAPISVHLYDATQCNVWGGDDPGQAATSLLL